uniref:Ig-like domain-containing protein n=1 Tax=Gadus morhua TaxID=8049 RepID=A0A8C5FHH6_GADMO
MLLIYVKLALLHLATSSQEFGNCKENATLKCDGIKEGSFNSITWTKMPSSRIIRRSHDKIQHYQFNRTAGLTDENSLLLPDLTPEDSGIYECQIGAKVGGQNTESKVVLEVPVCVTEPPTPEPPDLPIPQTICCFLVICLLKLLLPIIVAQVFHGLRRDVKSENPVPLS